MRKILNILKISISGETDINNIKGEREQYKDFKKSKYILF